MDLEQILKEYERDGVVRIKHFLDAQDLKAIRQEIENYLRNVAPGLEGSEVTFEADGKTARNLWRMEKHSHFFHSFARRRDLLDLVRELVKGEPVNLGV